MKEGLGHGTFCAGIGANAGPGASVRAGDCGPSAAWEFQKRSGEVHPLGDNSLCLTAQNANDTPATVQRCASVKPWMRRWAVTSGHRLTVAAADQYGSVRFLGGPGSTGELAVGNAKGKSLKSVPQWGFPAP